MKAEDIFASLLTTIDEAERRLGMRTMATSSPIALGAVRGALTQLRSVVEASVIALDDNDLRERADAHRLVADVASATLGIADDRALGAAHRVVGETHPMLVGDDPPATETVDAVAALERALISVTVSYRRLEQLETERRIEVYHQLVPASDVQVRTGLAQLIWDDVPNRVREAFLRGENAVSYRAYPNEEG